MRRFVVPAAVALILGLAAANTTNCAHGSLNTGQIAEEPGSPPGTNGAEVPRCTCDGNWTHSRPSDPLDFAAGLCEQFMCETDAQCRELLGIPDAECPVLGWNCDCGFEHAAFENRHAKCMYPWYVGAMKLKHSAYWMLVNLWKFFLLGALLLLPFGQNTVGPQEEYSWEVVGEDLAWTLWIVKLGLWTYAIIAALYLQILIIWISVLAFAIVLGFFIVAVCGLIGLAGGDSGGGCDAGTQCDVQACCNSNDGCCAGCCEGSAGNPCDGCCSACGDGCFGQFGCCHSCCDGYYYSSSGPLDGFDMQQLYASSNNAQLAHRKACNLCPFVKCVIPLFPKTPRNMLGGCVGHCMGTHSLCDAEHFTPSWWQQCLSTSCFHLQRRGEAWHQAVQGFVLETDADEAMRQAGQTEGPARPERGADGVIFIGGVVVEPQEGTFVNSNLLIYNVGDYQDNACWICCEPRGKFDLWLTCRHIFCSQCSTEMLRRRMPCPLCRVHTAKVIRRNSPDGGGASSGEELLQRTRGVQPQIQRNSSSQRAAPQQYTSVQQLSPSPQLLQQPVYAEMGQPGLVRNASGGQPGLMRSFSGNRPSIGGPPVYGWQ